MKSATRIHLFLPALTIEQAALLLDACNELIELLWRIHGDELGEYYARRVEHRDIEDPDPDKIHALSGYDDDDIDF